MNFKKWLNGSNMIYKDETGYIKGYKNPDGYWWIEEFTLFPKFRGKGLARKLAENLPQKSKMLVNPMFNMKGKILSKSQLETFYRSLGFEIKKDSHDNTIAIRENWESGGYSS